MLIEVLVAALVIVIGMIALAGVLIGAQNQASADVQQNQLINIADQQIEQVRADVGNSGLFRRWDCRPFRPPKATQASRSTWFDPEKFVEGGCFEIANNYDVVNVTAGAAAPYGTVPTGFTPWNSCNLQSEPLQILTSGAIVQEAGPSIGQCTGSGGVGNGDRLTLLDQAQQRLRGNGHLLDRRRARLRGNGLHICDRYIHRLAVGATSVSGTTTTRGATLPGH